MTAPRAARYPVKPGTVAENTADSRKGRTGAWPHAALRLPSAGRFYGSCLAEASAKADRPGDLPSEAPPAAGRFSEGGSAGAPRVPVVCVDCPVPERPPQAFSGRMSTARHLRGQNNASTTACVTPGPVAEERAGMTNIATAFRLLLELAEKHLGEIAGLRRTRREGH